MELNEVEFRSGSAWLWSVIRYGYGMAFGVRGYSSVVRKSEQRKKEG